MYGYNAEPPIAIPIYTVLPYCVIQEVMNLLHRFLPGWISSLTLLVLMSSVLTNYVSVHVCISVQVLVEAHVVEQ